MNVMSYVLMVFRQVPTSQRITQAGQAHILKKILVVWLSDVQGSKGLAGNLDGFQGW